MDGFDLMAFDLPRNAAPVMLSFNVSTLLKKFFGDVVRQGLSARRRGSVLTDLAMIAVQRGDVDQLVTHADAVLEIAVQTGSGFIGRKLHGLQGHLAPLLGNGRVRQVNQRIMAVSVSEG